MPSSTKVSAENLETKEVRLQSLKRMMAGVNRMTVKNAQGKIVEEVSKWEGVVSLRHRFGGTEFRLGKLEIGHIHGDYQADIAFPKSERDKLVAEGRAEPHHILPQSGWITLRIREEDDVKAAVELFRLSYNLALKK